jgi:hypothetical protein
MISPATHNDLEFTPPPPVEISETLMADVYPSQQSAMSALASRVVDAISAAPSTSEEIHLHAQPVGANLRALQEAVGRSFPNARVLTVDDTEGQKASTEVYVAIVPQNGRAARGNDRGRIEITVVRADAPAVMLSTKFISRPWAADPVQYMNERPDHIWIIGRSGRPALTEIEARRAAEEDAVRSVLPLVQRQSSPGGPTFPVPPLPMIPGTNVLAAPPSMAPLIQDIRHRLPVSDRFVQQYKRGYGTVWSELVLVDVSPHWLQSIGQQQSILLARRDVRMKTTIGSALIVLVTIMIAYLFLNAVTKSYFTGRLRTLAIVFGLAVVVVAAGILSSP